MSRAWVLNLDVERELAEPRGADPFAAMLKRPALLQALRALVGEDDVLERRSKARPGARGRAWCPTPAALEALALRGARPEPAPSLAILRRVNHRAFSAGLGATIEEAHFATDETEAAAILGRVSPTGVWLLKRPLGFAGRGRALAPPLTEAVLRFIRTCIRDEGGVQIEPLLARELDVSIHGHLDPRGRLTAGSPTVQVVTPHGAWCSTRVALAGELASDEAAALWHELVRVADALASAGYFGPFGVDAFRYLERGRSRLQPRCEINARYTMGWAIGMGSTRPDH